MNVCGHLGVNEPFGGLFTQGMVNHETYRAADKSWLSPNEVTVSGEGAARKAVSNATGETVSIGSVEKMSKSRRNTRSTRLTLSNNTAPTRHAGSCCRILRPSAM